jgi:hypothetical protein
MSYESEKVRAARDRYLHVSGYSAESYSDPRFSVAIGRLTLSMSNPGKVHYHDLHHVVSGYSTGLVGEGEVSTYELRAGCPSLMILVLCLGASAIGFVLSPRRIIKAWRCAKQTRTLYDSLISYETLLEMDVVELRRSLNIPVEGFGK